MRTKTIPKENTTLGCHKSFLPENYTMTERGNHPQLKMLIDCLLVDKQYLSTTIVANPLAKVVIGLRKVDLQEVVEVFRLEIVVTILQEVVVVCPNKPKSKNICCKTSRVEDRAYLESMVPFMGANELKRAKIDVKTLTFLQFLLHLFMRCHLMACESWKVVAIE
jgi:hypothetical protein